MFMINKVLNQTPRGTSNQSTCSIKRGYKQHVKNTAKKKGGGKGNYSSYLAANKWCKNVAFRAFHDVDDNKASYQFPSTMLMKTMEKRGSATEVIRAIERNKDVQDPSSVYVVYRCHLPVTEAGPFGRL